MTAPPRGKGATDEGDWVGIYHAGHTPGDDGSHDWSYHGSASGSGSVDAPSAAIPTPGTVLGARERCMVENSLWKVLRGPREYPRGSESCAQVEVAGEAAGEYFIVLLCCGGYSHGP
jgi:hypothetical protein